MPCRDDGRAAEEAHKALKEMQKKLDRVTYLLCKVVGQYGAGDLEVSEWYAEHQEAYRRRIQDEERQRHSRAAALDAEAARLRLEAERIRRGRP